MSVHMLYGGSSFSMRPYEPYGEKEMEESSSGKPELLKGLFFCFGESEGIGVGFV